MAKHGPDKDALDASQATARATASALDDLQDVLSDQMDRDLIQFGDIDSALRNAIRRYGDELGQDIDEVAEEALRNAANLFNDEGYRQALEAAGLSFR